MVSIRAVIAVIAVVVLAGASFGQRPKPAPRAPAPTTQSGQTSKPDPKEQNKNKDEEVVSGDEAVRLGTDLVNVLFTAVDRNNRVIGDIRQDEIIILEDGRPQQVFTFKRETTLPINIAILMDLSGSQEYTFPQEKIAAGLDYVKVTENTLTSPEALLAELEQVREQGWAHDNAEHEAFVHCIAAPIRDASGSVVAAASCSVPVVMLSYEGLLELLPDLKASTEAISKDLGWISHERNPA